MGAQATRRALVCALETAADVRASVCCAVSAPVVIPSALRALKLVLCAKADGISHAAQAKISVAASTRRRIVSKRLWRNMVWFVKNSVKSESARPA